MPILVGANEAGDEAADPTTAPAPPPPDMPPYTPRGSYSPAPATRPAAPAPAAPVDHTWDGIAAGYKTELEDLALQWQQVAGFGVTIDESALRKMADAHVVSLRDLGQWMWGQPGLMSIDQKQRSPWLAYGMDQSTFQRQLSDYLDSYEQLSGVRPVFGIDAAGNPSAPGAEGIWSAFGSNLTQSGYREKLLHDESMQKAYGWIKYGLTYDDFQQKKTDWRVTFGQDVSNEQAILQLQYFHQFQGSSREVTAPAPASQAPAPEISEVTVR